MDNEQSASAKTTFSVCSLSKNMLDKTNNYNLTNNFRLSLSFKWNKCVFCVYPNSCVVYVLP